MDEDLKIIISTELEADEEKSARRISKQLPSISEAINKISTIKVAVELDNGVGQNLERQISREMSKLSHHSVGLNVDFDVAAIRKLQSELNGLGLDGRLTKSITAEMGRLGVQIDKVSGTWKEAADGEERMLNLTLQGTDQLGRQVQIVKQFSYEAQTGTGILREQSSTVKRITADIEKQRQVQAKAFAEQKKADEQKLSFLIEQRQELEETRNAYTGKTGTKGITDTENLKDLEQNYGNVVSLLDKLEKEAGEFGAAQKSSVKVAIASLKDLAKEYYNAQNSAVELRAKDVTSEKISRGSELEDIGAKLQLAQLLSGHLQEDFAKLRDVLDSVGDSEGLRNYLNKLDEFKAKMGAAISDQKLSDEIRNINNQMAIMPSTVRALQGQMQQIANPTHNLRDNMADVVRLVDEWDDNMDGDAKLRFYTELQEKIALCKQEMISLGQAQRYDVRDERLEQGILKLRADIETTARTWSAFKSNAHLSDEFRRLKNDAQKSLTWPELQELNSKLGRFKSEVKAAGLNMQSLGDVLVNNAKKVLQWVSATTVLFRVFRLMKSSVKTVIDLDTAMIDLRKTTNATEAEYAQFYKTANETAKRLNVTTEAVISQSAAWSRLGYDIRAAAKLAEASSILKMISPSMSEEQSQSGLVSIIKAYGYQDVDNILDDIISKINIIGNTKALSNVDVVDILTRSSSAMAAANNTLEETIALGAAAQEIVQSADVVGTGLKTLSLRIRGYDESTEEYSDDIAMLTGEIADLTKTAKTPGGISLFEVDNPEQYKSTYQILKEISEIWNDLTDKNRAKLLEALFGKRQAQIGSAILTNFKQAEKSMEDMQNAAGNAEAEMAVIMDSIDYRLNALRETWVGVSQSLFQSDDIKAGVAILQGASDVVAELTGSLGGLGTVGVGVLGVALYKIIKTSHDTRESLYGIVSNLNMVGNAFDNGVKTIGEYADKLQSLNTTQRAVVMGSLGLSGDQQKQINAFIQATAACDGLTLAEILGSNATKRQKEQTDKLTQSQLIQLAVSGKMSGKLRDAILKRGAEAAATDEQKAAQDRLNISVGQYLAMQWKTAAGKIAMVTTAISALIAVGSFAYNLWKQHQEKITSDANAAIDSYEQVTKAAEDYKSKISELKDSLDSGNLSEQEAYDIRKELLEIKDKIIDAYGAEARAIDIVGDSAEKTNGKLNDLTKGLALKYLGENSEKIDKATKELETKVRTYDLTLGSFYQWNGYDDDIKNRFYKLLEKYDNVSLTANIDGGTAGLGHTTEVIRLRANALEADEILTKLSADIKDIEKELESSGKEIPGGFESFFHNIYKEIGDAQRDVDKLYDENKKYYDQAVVWRIVSDDDLSAIDKSISDIKKRYQEAVAEGNEDVAAAVIDGLNDVDIDNVKNDSVKLYFKELVDGIQDEARKTVVHVKVKAEVENNSKSSNLLFGLSQLKGKDGDIKLSDVRATEQSFLSGLGSRGLTRAENGYAVLQEEAKKYGIEVEDLIGILIEQGKILDDVGEKAQKAAKGVTPLTDIVSGFAKTEDGINKLSTALKEFSDNGVVSIGTLNDIGQEMGKCDSFEEFYAIMLDGNATMEQAQAITNRLAGEYIDNAEALGELTEENREHIRTTLDKLGVLNSEEVVESRLAQQYAKAKVAEIDLTKATWADVEAKLQEDGATQRQIDALKKLKVEQLNAITSTEDFANGNMVAVTSAIAAAHALGLESKSLRDLEYLKTHPNASGVKESMGLILAGVQDDVAKALADIQALVNKPITINVPKNGSNGSKSSSSKSATSKNIAELDRFYKATKALNDEQERTARIESQLERTHGLEDRLKLHHELEEAYSSEKDKLHNLNNEYDSAIKDGIQILQSRGFKIQYNGETNDLELLNPEHFRELSARELPNGLKKFATETSDMLLHYVTNSQGAIETFTNTTEAVNELIKDSESIWDTIANWNEGNKGRSDEDYFKVEQSRLNSMIEASKEIVEDLENRVELAENRLGRAISNHSYGDIQNEAGKQVAIYKQIQAEIHAQAEYYRAMGYDDTSDEISELSNLWFEYASKIKMAHAQAWDAVLDNMHTAVDEIQNVYDTLHKAADEYAASGGAGISIDTMQEVLDLGVEYINLLDKENGKLVINEDGIRRIIAARTEQLAIEQSLAYISRLRAAMEGNDEKAKEQLLGITIDTANATWDLVAAELEYLRVLGLTDDEFQLAERAINNYYSLATAATDGFGKSLDDVGDLLDYVISLIEQQVKDQIEALNKQKEAYQSLIDMERERLRNAKEENDYQKDIQKRLAEQSKLQDKIDSLKLSARSGDRKAQAELAKAQEEMNSLQDELAQKQAEHTLEAQEKILDDMNDSYQKSKDEEIDILEDSISSYQKKYDKAIEYVENNYNTLLNDLKSWNYSYGNDLESKLVSAWTKAKEAAESYYGVANGRTMSNTLSTWANSGRSSSGDSASSGGNSVANDKNFQSNVSGITPATVGRYSTEDIIKQMYRNSQMWHSASSGGRATLEQNNMSLANYLIAHRGMNLWKDGNGVWYEDTEKLFKKYNVYHTGGVVGGRRDEEFALLQKGEWVLSREDVERMREHSRLLQGLRQMVLQPLANLKNAFMGTGLTPTSNTNISNITNTDNRPVEINYEVNINGANQDAIRQHQKVSRDTVNEIARLIGLKQ